MPCFAQQVRVIAGDIEHLYGPGGELLDNADPVLAAGRMEDPPGAEPEGDVVGSLLTETSQKLCGSDEIREEHAECLCAHRTTHPL